MLARGGRWTFRRLGAPFLLLSSVVGARGQSGSTPVANSDPSHLNFDQLMNLEVTTASRRPEQISKVPSAVYVLTQEDIRDQGSTSLAEALRTVPGMEVARADANTWAISVRGFNDVYANKLLVQIDGRSVYRPLFSGVNWDWEDVYLPDIERIEVVRGPGGTLWGANAVNGVVNVVTKSAKDTTGTLLSIGGGTEDRGFAGARYGVQVTDNSWLRVYGKYFDRDASIDPTTGSRAGDGYSIAETGFRFDAEPSLLNSFTLEGDFYATRANQIVNYPLLEPPYAGSTHDNSPSSGSSLLGRWTHTFSDESKLQTQTYYAHTYDKGFDLAENRDVWDFDLQHQLNLGSWNDVVWGGGYRVTEDRLRGSSWGTYSPDTELAQLASVFAQDEVTLVKDRLKLTFGTKLEHNDYTGFELQPSTRLAWTPDERQTIWASIGRAVRTPSRAERDIRIISSVLPPGSSGPPFDSGAPLPAAETLIGQRSFRSETLLAYELGYRIQPLANLKVDVATFYNTYDKLRSLDVGTPAIEGFPAPTDVLIPVTAGNHIFGETYGCELAVVWQAAEWWRIRGSYSFIGTHMETDGLSTDVITVAQLEGQTPRHHASIASSFSLPHDITFSSMVRAVDELHGTGVQGYAELDLRLAWHPRRDLEVSVVGQNLLHDHHAEFAPSSIRSTQATAVERGVYGQIALHF